MFLNLTNRNANETCVILSALSYSILSTRFVFTFFFMSSYLGMVLEHFFAVLACIFKFV